jgi:hypothetical protein
MNMENLIDKIFIFSSLIFNISVSILYIATKFGNMMLVQLCGCIVISLIIPFTITLLGYRRRKEKKRTIISHVFILFYISLELLLDYILKIPFREMLVIHAFYIIVFYTALFSMISVSYEKNRKMGSFVIITFLILMGCLIYYLSPF